MKLQDTRRDGLTVCLPESFEWLLLRSGVVRSEGLDIVLADPAAHVDSRRHMSWERFFTDLLVQSTAGTVFAYQKSQLAEAYKLPANADKVMALIACRNIK